MDITGSTVYFTVRSTAVPTSADDSDALIAKSTTSHSAPAAGTTSISLTSSDTNQTPGEYRREIQIKFANGNILSAGTDTLIIEQDLTKSTA